MSAPPIREPLTERPEPVTRAGPARVARATLKQRLQGFARGLLDPLVGLLERTHARPDQVTLLGTLLACAAGLAFFEGRSRLAATLLLASGVCDILDGQLARRQGPESRFGAFLDSTLDRIADAAVLAGIAGFYLRNLLALVYAGDDAIRQIEAGLVPDTWAVMAFVSLLALVGSLLVSYTRARAEGLGLECKVGWFERPERMALLIVAGFVHRFWVMSAALLLLVVLSFWTAGQRVRHVWKITRGAGRDGR